MAVTAHTVNIVNAVMVIWCIAFIIIVTIGWLVGWYILVKEDKKVDQEENQEQENGVNHG